MYHGYKRVGKNIKVVLCLVAMVAFVMSMLSSTAFATGNLLTNPGAESGSTTGWTSSGSWAYTWATPHTGSYSFDTTYTLGTLTQKINLLTNGYTQNQLDTQQPAITFSVWVATRGDQAGRYFLNFQLLGSDGATVKASSGSTYGTSSSLLSLPSGTNWFQQTYTFNNYGSGVQYVSLQMGGRDQSGWAGYYGTEFDDASITVNYAPDSPSSLGPAANTTGGWTASQQPNLTFNLSDTDTSDTVKYELQLDTHADFSSPVVDYISALAAQGPASFTVGQPPGGGGYTAGSSGQTLAEGSYYWRVLAKDSNNASSSYVAANSGSPAFIVDASAPTVPGTPASASLSKNNQPVWSWAPSTDSGAGLATVPYTVAWSQDSSFASGVSSTTTSTAWFTIPSALADGTWYFRVKAQDTLGNMSAYSAAGQFTVAATTKSSKPVAVNSSMNASTSSTPSSVPTTVTQTVLLNDFSTFTAGVGKAISLATNQAVYFQERSELHTAIVSSVGDDYAVVVVHSNPITLHLNVGETKQLNVSGIGSQPEIAITLTSITNGVAQLVFAQLKHPASTSPTAIVVASKSGASPVALALAIGGCLIACLLLWRFRVSRLPHHSKETEVR